VFLHSFHGLSHDRYIASSNVSPPSLQSSASSFNFHKPLISLSSASSSLCLLSHLPVPPILCYIIPSITCFRRQILHKMWPIYLGFLVFIVGRLLLSSWTLRNTSFWHYCSKLTLFILCQHHISKFFTYFWGGTRWCCWLRHWTANQKVWFPVVSLEYFIDIIHMWPDCGDLTS